MKSTLFNNLEHAENSVTNAVAQINTIHASRGSYNYWVSVPYLHKCKVSCGWFKTNWVWRTETRHRDEQRFDQGRFDGDLSAGHHNLSQAQQSLYLAEQAIRTEAQSMENRIAQVNNLSNEVYSIRNANIAMQNNLAHLRVTTANAPSRVSNFREQKNDLITQKNNLSQEVTLSLPSMINQINHNNANKQVELNNCSQLAEQAAVDEQTALNRAQATSQTLSTQVSRLENEVSNVNHANTIVAGNLTHLYVTASNAANRVNNFRTHKDNLTTQKNNLSQEVTLSLPSRINQVSQDNALKQAELNSLTQQGTIAAEHKKTSLENVMQRLQNISETERSSMAHKMIVTDNKTILKILEQLGFWTEKLAEIAVTENQQIVFDYCLNKGLKYDSLVNEQDTLASFIIKNGNEYFKNQLFASNQEFKTTIFLACANNDFDVLAELLKHDAQALHKFKEVEGCGLSALQYAIACKNVALLDFIAKHDASCFNEAVIGYDSYFKMALCYNSAEIIKLVSTHSDYKQELVDLISTNQIDMLERAVANIEIPPEQILSILRLCIDNNYADLAEIMAQKITDIKQALVVAASNSDLELVTTLIAAHPEELSVEYCTSLLGNCDENTNSILQQILTQDYDGSIEQVKQITGENSYNYDQQFSS